MAENDDVVGGHSEITFTGVAGATYIVTAASKGRAQSSFAPIHFRLSISKPVNGTAVVRSISPEVTVFPKVLTLKEGRAANLTVKTGLIQYLGWKRPDTYLLVDMDYSLSNFAYPILSAKPSDEGEYSCQVVYYDTNGVFQQPSSAGSITVNVDPPVASTNIWKQEQFIIGAIGDPGLTGNAAQDSAAYQAMRNANLNMSTGQPSRGIGLSDSWETFNSGTVSNRYRLERISKVPGLSMMAYDGTFTHAMVNLDTAGIAYAISHQYAFGTETLAMKTALRNALFGYHVADEPLFYQYGDGRDAGIGENLRKLEAISVRDPSKPGFINLRAGFGFHSWTEYEKYVNDFALNPETKILSFDYYPFNQNALDGYWLMPVTTNDKSTFFKHYNLFGSAVKAALARGKYMTFWGVASSIEEVLADRHHPNPDESQLRYQAFTPVVYGAKGVVWYFYEMPEAMQGAQIRLTPTRGPSGDTTAESNALLSRFTLVNGELQRMGDVLMKLNWITTIHGSVTDPYSGETPLVTQNDGQTVMNTAQSIPAQYAIGIFSHSESKENYLTILNKNVTHPRTKVTAPTSSNYFLVNGQFYVYQYNKTSGSWSVIPRTINSTATGFHIYNQAPGDVEIIRLTKLPWLPAVRSLLN